MSRAIPTRPRYHPFRPANSYLGRKEPFFATLRINNEFLLVDHRFASAHQILLELKKSTCQFGSMDFNIAQANHVFWPHPPIVGGQTLVDQDKAALGVLDPQAAQAPSRSGPAARCARWPGRAWSSSSVMSSSGSPPSRRRAWAGGRFRMVRPSPSSTVVVCCLGAGIGRGGARRDSLRRPYGGCAHRQSGAERFHARLCRESELSDAKPVDFRVAAVAQDQPLLAIKKANALRNPVDGGLVSRSARAAELRR